MAVIDCGGRALDLSSPAVMGILNITPDSFSDGGIFLDREKAIAHACQMAEQGARIIDIGGESTRPGAREVSVTEEIDRVVPVIEAIARAVSVPVSVDTSKPDVMRAAVAAGAGMINDVRALRAHGAVETAAALRRPVVLMHMHGEPSTMQQNPQYSSVTHEVVEFLKQRIRAAMTAGIPSDQILIDPGFGFGKTVDHNLELLRNLPQLKVLGPVVAGLSRKSMIEKLLGLPVERRVHASVALALIAVQNGAQLVRVHDVAATVEALAMAQAVRGEVKITTNG